MHGIQAHLLEGTNLNKIINQYELEVLKINKSWGFRCFGKGWVYFVGVTSFFIAVTMVFYGVGCLYLLALKIPAVNFFNYVFKFRGG